MISKGKHLEENFPVNNMTLFWKASSLLIHHISKAAQAGNLTFFSSVWHGPFTSLFAKLFKWRFFVYLFFLQRYKILLGKITACTTGECKKIELADLFLWGKTFCSENTGCGWEPDCSRLRSDTAPQMCQIRDKLCWPAASCTILLHLWKQQAPRDTALCALRWFCTYISIFWGFSSNAVHQSATQGLLLSCKAFQELSFHQDLVSWGLCKLDMHSGHIKAIRTMKRTTITPSYGMLVDMDWEKWFRVTGTKGTSRIIKYHEQVSI